MLRNLKDLECEKISVTGGEIGRVKAFCFEDDAWVFQWAGSTVLETGI